MRASSSIGCSFWIRLCGLMISKGFFNLSARGFSFSSNSGVVMMRFASESLM